MSINSASQGMLRPAQQKIAEGGEVGVGLHRGELLHDMFWGGRLARIGTTIIVFVMLFCFVGPLLYRTNQTQPDQLLITDPPSGQHLLGTDGNGFDELGQLMIGGQSALEIGLASAFLASIFGRCTAPSPDISAASGMPCSCASSTRCSPSRACCSCCCWPSSSRTRLPRSSSS